MRAIRGDGDAVLVMSRSLNLEMNSALILLVKQVNVCVVLGATPRSKRHETDYKQKS
jgi:hypothetical protein